MLPRAVRCVGDVLPKEPLHRRSQEEGLQGGKYSYDLAHLNTWKQVSDRSNLLLKSAEFLRHAVPRQGRGDQWSLLRNAGREGSEYLDKDGKPTFNSEAGVRALDWFVNMYKARRCQSEPQLPLG